MNTQNSRTLSIKAWILLGLIIVESALGSRSEPLLITHIILGILLLVGSVIFLMQATRYQSTAWKIPAIIGIFGIFIAIVAGSLFTYTDGRTYLSVMEFGATLSICSYGWGLWAARKEGNKITA